MTRGKALLLLLVAALAALYSLNVGRYYVGLFNDDARHILAAQALLQGRYDDLCLPFRSPAVNLLPGYPLLLTLPAALDCLPCAQYLSIVFSLLAVVLMGLLTRRRACSASRRPRGLWGPRGGAGTYPVVLFALHPMLVGYSGTVMTEPAFLFWSLAAFWWLDRDKGGPPRTAAGTAPVRKTFPGWRPLPFVLWVSFAAWIRPHGVLLLPAVLPSVLKDAGRRQKALLWAAAGLFVLIPYARNILVSGTPASYFDEIPRAAGALAGVRLLLGNVLSNMGYYLSAIPAVLVASPESRTNPYLYPVFAAVWLLLGKGFVEVWSDERRARLRPRAAYLLLVLLAQLFWVNQAERYLLILLPFLYELLLLPFERLAGWRRYAPLAALLPLMVIQDARGTLATLRGTDPAGRAPTETWAWARANSDPGDVFVAPHRQSAYLHTGRKTFSYFYYEDPDDFFEYLLAHRVKYVWVDRSTERMRTTAPRSARLRLIYGTMESRLRDRTRFRPAYSNRKERIALFEVIRSEEFLEARAKLLAVRAALGAGDWRGALEKLRALERERAPLSRLDFLMGTTAMLAGEPALARPRLEAALDKEPGFAKARENLCRVYRSLGETGPAARVCAASR